MKAVMLSIQPKWCELIASEKKTVEVRKTKPKIDVPFKCYIYETKGKLRWCNKCQDTDCERPYPNCACWEGQGKVIGEFVCDKIVEFENSWYDPAFSETSELSCVGWEELALYLGGKEIGYGWHITDLVIYDKPKELSEFFTVKEIGGYEEFNVINRPPQSWFYCEKIESKPLVEGKTITIPKWEYKE